MEPLATFGHVVLTQLDSPGSILIAYTIVGFLVFLVMSGLGEMAAWLPLGSGFSGYATRFCDPALGFALGYVRFLPPTNTCGALVKQRQQFDSREMKANSILYRPIGSNTSS